MIQNRTLLRQHVLPWHLKNWNKLESVPIEIASNVFHTGGRLWYRCIRKCSGNKNLIVLSIPTSLRITAKLVAKRAWIWWQSFRP